MGVWFLSPAIAQFIGGMTFSQIEKIEKGELFNPIIGGQADFFLIFVITSCGAGIVMLAISPILKKLMHGRA
jgi:POT family proton-dependent oligopeptide transporter